MTRKAADLIEWWEGVLRLDRLESASDQFRARVVYITSAIFFVLQIVNGVQMYVAYGGWILDHTLLMVAVIMLTGLMATLRWHANFDMFAFVWGSVMLMGILGTALPQNIGINSALLPNMVGGIVLIAMLSSLRSLMLYSACMLLMILALHINAGGSDPSILSDPAYIAERNMQRTVQATIVVVMIASIMGLLTFSLTSLFSSLERSRDAAKAVSAAKTQFLADMSHELRTPLNGVLGMNQLILRSELDDTQRHYAEIIHDCGAGMIAVIDDVLDLSRLEGGKVDLRPTPFNPAKMLEAIVALHQANASAKDVQLHLNVQPGLPDLFVGDHGRLRQIVGNLVSNAVKFTDEGFVALSLRGEPMADGRWWLNLFVQDSGIGITPARQARIFERFEQAEDGQTNTVRGSGLGLAICKELTSLFGGEIGVRSAPGQGSTFCVAIPLPVATPKRAQPAPLDPAPAETATVETAGLADEDRRLAS
ncbi:MAG: ATP-binding protein [Litorimonas sp.]